MMQKKDSGVHEMQKNYFEITKIKGYEIEVKSFAESKIFQTPEPNLFITRPYLKDVQNGDIGKITFSSSNQKHMCFITEKCPLPFASVWPPDKQPGQPLIDEEINNAEFHFKPLGTLDKTLDLPTCLEVAYDSSYLVTGYADGNICVFDPKNFSFVTQINRQKKEDGSVGPITKIAFAQTDYKSIVACDRIGNIFQIHNFAKANRSEVVLFEGSMPLRNIFMPKTDSPFLIFADNNSVNVLNIETREFADISSSPLGESIRFDAKVNTDGSVLLITWNGTYFSMFRIESYTKITSLFEKNFVNKIKECIIRKNYVVSIIFFNGSIDLVIGSADPRIEQYYTTNLMKIIKIYNVWTKSHETLFMLTPKAMYKIKFVEWAERLLKLTKDFESWDLLCSMAEGIYTGSNLHVFGLEADTFKRCNQLQALLKSRVLGEMAAGCGDDPARIAQTFDLAVVCDLKEFVIDTAYHLFKEDDRLLLYYNVIFTKMRRNIAQCLPYEFYQEYLSLPSITPYDKIKDLQDTIVMNILRRGIPRQYAPRLIQLAHSLDSEPFLLRLWTECFGDFISPCIYLLKSEKLIDYMSDIFLDEKYSLLRVHKQLVALYFCTEVDGSYPRLIHLFSKSWTYAPKFAQAFVKLLPIQLKNGEELGEKEFATAIINFSCNKPNESQPLIDVVATIIVNNEIKIPYTCIDMLIKWAFTTNATKASIREEVVMLIHDQYPTTIVYKDILPYCESAGFPRIVNQTFLQNQAEGPVDFEMVIKTMAIQEEWRPYIFDYIHNPYSGSLNKLKQDRLAAEAAEREKLLEAQEGEENQDKKDDYSLDEEDENKAETTKKALTGVFNFLNQSASATLKNANILQDGLLALQKKDDIPPAQKAMMNDLGDDFGSEDGGKEEESDGEKVMSDFSLESSSVDFDSLSDEKKFDEKNGEKEEEEEEEEETPENTKDDDSEHTGPKLIIEPQDDEEQYPQQVPQDKDAEVDLNNGGGATKLQRVPTKGFMATGNEQKEKKPERPPVSMIEDSESSQEINFSELEEEDMAEDGKGKFKRRGTIAGSRPTSAIFDRLQQINKEKQMYEANAESFSVATSPEMKQTINNTLSLLVLIDADKAVELIGNDYQEEIISHQFLKSNAEKFVKYLYLKSLVNSDYFNLINPAQQEKDINQLFELTCEFSPQDVLPMIKSSETIEIDKALPTCQKYRVIDACIYIHTMLGDMQSAVNLVSEELEANLVEPIQSGQPINAPSIDLVKEEPALQKAYNTVVITFDLLSKAPNQLTDRMWKDIFLSFQLPLWLIQQENVDENLKRSICYFFAFFIVETLQQNRSSPENIFNTYELQFREINQKLYTTSLSAVFKYLDYNQKLAETVIQLLMADCINLYGRAQRTKTRAAFVYHTNCAYCNTPITGAGGVGAIVYECGHAYHDDMKCGKHSSVCQICKGNVKPPAKSETAPLSQGAMDRAIKQKLRKLQRVDYSLKRRYGKGSETSESGVNAFFIQDYPVQAKNFLIMPQIEKWPEVKNVFVEL